jgi:hypothetical protein
MDGDAAPPRFEHLDRRLRLRRHVDRARAAGHLAAALVQDVAAAGRVVADPPALLVGIASAVCRRQVDGQRAVGLPGLVAWIGCRSTRVPPLGTRLR